MFPVGAQTFSNGSASKKRIPCRLRQGIRFFYLKIEFCKGTVSHQTSSSILYPIPLTVLMYDGFLVFFSIFSLK